MNLREFTITMFDVSGYKRVAHIQAANIRGAKVMFAEALEKNNGILFDASGTMFNLNHIVQAGTPQEMTNP